MFSLSTAKSFLLALGLTFSISTVHADIPTAEILVAFVPSSPSYQGGATARKGSKTEDGKTVVTLLATQATFGTYPPQQKDILTSEGYPFTFKPVFAPEIDPLSCNTDEEMAEMDQNDIPTYDSTTVMLIPRGRCTFEQKALNAQNRYKVGGIIIYETLASRYGYNETSEEVIYPLNKYDYDCEYGEGYMDASKLTFDPYYDPSNDALMNYQCETTQNDNVCASHKCLLTSPPESGGFSQLCCAWDLHITLYHDSSIPSNTTDTTVAIPAMFITMGQFDELNEIMISGKYIELSMFARNRPDYNLSGVFVWALGVFTAALAAYLSAEDIRNKMKRNVSRSLIREEHHQRNTPVVEQERADLGDQSRLRSRSPRPSPTSQQPRDASMNSPRMEEVSPSRQHHIEDDMEEDPMEITLSHAIFFLIWSSFSLFVLFFFKIYNVVKVMYAIGCAGALSQVIIYPLYRFLNFGKLNIDRIFFSTNFLEIGPISYLDFASSFTGYTLGAVWLYIAFTQHNSEQIPFFWIMQDLMGISICIVFLSILRVNNLKIASALLIAAFFYDIFFVFITPFLFSGKSIMVTVATSGGPPTADPLWCEKYPSDEGCQGGEPLPMLLTIPRLADYLGGASLLGLGDIVLPGLVLSFASRLDESKKLVAYFSGGRDAWFRQAKGNACGCLKEAFSGYFGPVVVAYAIGLMMANVAVYVMQMGQPALLYLVPLCLGSLFFTGWRKGEVYELWDGPKVLRAADRIVSGREYIDHRNQQAAMEDDISLTRLGAEDESRGDEDSFVNRIT